MTFLTKKTSNRAIYYVRDINTIILNGMTVRHIGSFPGDKCIFFYFGKGGDREMRRTLYLSAVEAFLNGYDVIYKPQLYLSQAVEKAALESPRGSIYPVYPKGLGTISNYELGKSLMTGGGAFSIVEDDAYYSFPALLASDYLASFLSRAMVLCSYNGRYCPRFIIDHLSDGKSLCVLRPGLKDRVLCNLVREGAMCCDSFSSFLSDPSVILYPKKSGSYGIDGFHFDIMKV